MTDRMCPAARTARLLVALVLISLVSASNEVAAQSVVGTKCEAAVGTTAHLGVLERWISDVWHEGVSSKSRAARNAGRALRRP